MTYIFLILDYTAKHYGFTLHSFLTNKQNFILFHYEQCSLVLPPVLSQWASGLTPCFSYRNLSCRRHVGTCDSATWLHFIWINSQEWAAWATGQFCFQLHEKSLNSLWYGSSSLISHHQGNKLSSSPHSYQYLLLGF